MPEFTFVVEGRGAPKVYPDRVLRPAEAAINKRERYKYKNSVEIVAPLPKMTPDKSKELHSLDGVATWTGIDPNVVYFSIYMSGFSNGYKVGQGPNGEEIVTRRTLAQKFWRPGDRFDQLAKREIRLQDEPKWMLSLKAGTSGRPLDHRRQHSQHGASHEKAIGTMAHKKGQGSTRNGRDSRAQRLGIKKFGGEAVIPGNIIVRQCGTKWRPGRNVGLGSDYTIFALVEGKVFFDQEGRRVNVEVLPAAG